MPSAKRFMLMEGYLILVVFIWCPSVQKYQHLKMESPNNVDRSATRADPVSRYQYCMTCGSFFIPGKYNRICTISLAKG